MNGETSCLPDVPGGGPDRLRPGRRRSRMQVGEEEVQDEFLLDTAA
jgi:hypothetical protein